MQYGEYDQQVQRFEAALDVTMPATGDPRQDVTRNLLRISTGVATIEEVGEPFYRASDGSMGINVEGTVFEGLARELRGK